MVTECRWKRAKVGLSHLKNILISRDMQYIYQCSHLKPLPSDALSLAAGRAGIDVNDTGSVSDAGFLELAARDTTAPDKTSPDTELLDTTAPDATVLGGSGKDAGPAEIRFCMYADAKILDIVEKIRPMNMSERRFALDRLSRGDRVVIGYHDAEPVFYGWLMFDALEMTYGIFLDLPPGTAFGYNLFTKKSHRRRGLMTGFYEFVIHQLRRQGMHTLYVGIDTYNSASALAHRKNGFRKSGYFHTVRLFGACFTLARFKHARRFYLRHSLFSG